VNAFTGLEAAEAQAVQVCVRLAAEPQRVCGPFPGLRHSIGGEVRDADTIGLPQHGRVPRSHGRQRTPRTVPLGMFLCRRRGAPPPGISRAFLPCFHVYVYSRVISHMLSDTSRN
jgi:hypothetical protein